MRGQKLSKIHFLILLSLLGFISPLQSQEYKFRNIGCGGWIVANNGERYLPG